MQVMALDPQTVAEDEAGIVAAAINLERSLPLETMLYRPRGFPYPADAPAVWVKYGEKCEQLRSEALTQDYIHQRLSELPEDQKREVRVPQIFNAFYGEIDEKITKTFIVMEYVRGTSMTGPIQDNIGNPQRQCVLISRVFDVLNTLLAIQPEADTPPGPTGGGRIEHFVFDGDDSRAPREFETLK
jgi:hypothetical protein